MLFNGFRAIIDAGGYGSRLALRLAGTTKIIPAARIVCRRGKQPRAFSGLTFAA
jgi:hypothetical protein